MENVTENSRVKKYMCKSQDPLRMGSKYKFPFYLRYYHAQNTHLRIRTIFSKSRTKLFFSLKGWIASCEQSKISESGFIIHIHKGVD